MISAVNNSFFLPKEKVPTQQGLLEKDNNLQPRNKKSYRLKNMLEAI